MSRTCSRLLHSPQMPGSCVQRGRFHKHCNIECPTGALVYCKLRLLIFLIAATLYSVQRAESQEVAVPAENPRVFASIEETYNTFRQAVADQDAERIWNCYSPELQVEECFELYFECLMQPNDPEIARILKAHGINSESIEAFYLKKYREKHGADWEPNLPSDYELMTQVVSEAVVDKAGFYKDLMSGKNANKPTAEPKPATSPFEALISITVNGDSAEGTAYENSTFSPIHRDENGVERIVHQRRRDLNKITFTCHRGKWLIRAIAPVIVEGAPQVGVANGPITTVDARQLQQVVPPETRAVPPVIIDRE